jgi:hypothetical protein
MQYALRPALVAFAALGLAACAVDSQAPARQSAPVPQQPASPIPNVGFSPSVSNAAIAACRNALDAQTEGNIDVVGSEYSEANVVVYMTVGSNRAPWKCFTANDGSYANTEFMGSEGAL